MMDKDKKPIYFGRDLEAMSFAVNYHKWIIDEFKPYLGRNVAEVGAGTGNFSELLLKQVEHLVLFEPSANMYPILKERFSDNPRVTAINNTFGSECSKFAGHLDSIIYVNVLEHIEDDVQELSHIHETLTRGGHALLFVPALSFLYSELDKELGHFRRYHKGNLIKLAKDTGFNIEKAKYFDCAGIIPWYIAFVLLKTPITGSRVSLYDKLVVPVMRNVEKLVSPPVGKNLLLVIRKV